MRNKILRALRIGEWHDLGRAHASGNIGLRTFERGVEAETGACGTGAIATALAAASLYDLQSPITITPTSGEQLFVEFRRAEEGAFHDIVLGGPAVTLG